MSNEIKGLVNISTGAGVVDADVRYAKVICTAVNLYVATTGSDTTGDGTIGLPWATLGKALTYLNDYRINNSGTVTINMLSGEYDIAAVQYIRHLDGERISILGESTTGFFVTGILSAVGAAKSWILEFQLDTAVGITVGQYVIVGNYPNYMPYTDTDFPVWVANTAYSVGDWVRPTAANDYGHVMECTTAGTSHGTTEPTWGIDDTTYQKIAFSIVPTAGAFTLTFAEGTTASCAYNIDSATLQTRIRDISANYIGVTVTGNTTIGFTIAFNQWLYVAPAIIPAHTLTGAGSVIVVVTSSLIPTTIDVAIPDNGTLVWTKRVQPSFAEGGFKVTEVNTGTNRIKVQSYHRLGFQPKGNLAKYTIGLTVVKTKINLTTSAAYFRVYDLGLMDKIVIDGGFVSDGVCIAQTGLNPSGSRCTFSTSMIVANCDNIGVLIGSGYCGYYGCITNCKIGVYVYSEWASLNLSYARLNGMWNFGVKALNGGRAQIFNETLITGCYAEAAVYAALSGIVQMNKTRLIGNQDGILAYSNSHVSMANKSYMKHTLGYRVRLISRSFVSVADVGGPGAAGLEVSYDKRGTVTPALETLSADQCWHTKTYYT